MKVIRAGKNLSEAILAIATKGVKDMLESLESIERHNVDPILGINLHKNNKSNYLDQFFN